jgi:hypothetical protein
LNSGTGIQVQTNGFNNFTIVNTGDNNGADDVTNTSQADGDVSGTFSNLQLKPSVVSATELQNGAVTANKLASMNAASGQVLKWNGTAWAPSADNTGTVTLTAGAGITITGTAPNFTITNAGDTDAGNDLTTATQANGDVSGLFSNLQIKPNVVTGAEIADNAVDNSELANNAVTSAKVANGAITAAKLANMGAANGDVLKYNGTAWAPAPDGGGGGSFDVVAGAGMDVTQVGTTFTVINTGDLNDADDLTNTSQANGDVSGPFSNLQIKPNVVTNAEIADNAVGTSELANAAVTGAKIFNMGAAVGQVLKWNGATWAPANDNGGGGGGDNWGTQTAAVAAALIGDGTNGSPLNLAQQGAAVGQVLKWNGTTWLPQNDNTGSGSSDTYNAGPGISITGSSPNFTINNTGDADNDVVNEIQQLSIAGNQLSLSKGGGTVILPAGGGNNYNAGPGISITGVAPNLTINNTGDTDNNATNELQTISLTGNVVSLSQNNSSIDLTPLLGGVGFWKLNGTHIFNANADNVLIGTANSTSGKLQVVNGNAAHEAARFTQTAGTKAAVYGDAGAGAGGFFTSTTGPALITGAGNVGIGANIPAARLHVSGNGESVRLQGNTPSIVFAPTGAAPGGNVGGYIKNIAPAFQIGTSADVQGIYLLPNGKNALYAEGQDGNVSIGSDALPTGKLHVFHEGRGLVIENKASEKNWEFWVNDADATLNLFNTTLGPAIPAGTFAINGVYLPSDRRLKKDIAAIPTGTLAKVLALNPVTYRYKAEAAGATPSIGFLAQEVQGLFPELVGNPKVRGNGEKMLSVNYAGFGVLAIKAIQEQQQQLEQLKQENDSLRQKTMTLEARLEKLEKAMSDKKD